MLETYQSETYVFPRIHFSNYVTQQRHVGTCNDRFVLIQPYVTDDVALACFIECVIYRILALVKMAEIREKRRNDKNKANAVKII